MARVNFESSSRKNRDLPFSLRFGGQARRSQKRFVTVNNSCNITWDYVA